MGKAALFKAIRGMIKGASIGKVATALEYTALGLSAAEIGDEIARTIMGENYDPALRDLAEEVAAAGMRYDERIKQIVETSYEGDKLVSGINSLTAIVLDYGDHQQLAEKLLDKLDELRTTLHSSVPKTFLWMELVEAGASKDAQNQQDRDAKLEQLKSVNAPDLASALLFFGGEMLLALGFYAWGRWTGPGKRPPMLAISGKSPAATTNVRRMTAEWSDSKRAEIRRIRDGMTGLDRPKGRVRSVATNFAKATPSLATFGLSIYFVVQKVKSRNEAIDELRKLKAEYDRILPIYDAVLNGFEHHPEVSPDDAFEFFDIDPASLNEDARAGWDTGLVGVHKGYEQMLSDLLVAMDLAYSDVISELETVATTAADGALIAGLQTAHTKHQGAQHVALDSTLAADTRFIDGIIKARDVFVESLADQLNTLLEALSFAVDNHNASQMLLSAAQFLSEQALNIESEMQALIEAHPNLPPDIIAMLREEKEKALQADITREVSRLLSDFDELFVARTIYITLEEIDDALRMAITELSGSRAAPSVALEATAGQALSA